jgi:hypothetical protein
VDFARLWSSEETVFADEGGLRCVVEDTPRYVPFARIADASLTTPVIGRSTLWLTTAEGDGLEVTLPAHVDTDSIVGLILDRSTAARATAASALARRGDLAMWIASVAASNVAHRDGTAYRAQSVDTELLEQTLADVSDANEARAAAAHALMSVGRSDTVARLVGATSPPLVVAAVRLARGGEAIVSDALLEHVLPFLELRDRVVFLERQREG